MRGRSPEKELWIFAHGEILVLPRPENLTKLLVEIGLAESNSDATRLLKSNSIQQREWYGEDTWGKPEMVTGASQWIRRGKKYYDVVTYMLPEANQTEYTWWELVNEGAGYETPKLRWF